MTINIGIIGCGSMGGVHLNCYRLIPGVKVVGVADINEEKAKKVADSIGAKAYSVDELIENPEINSVSICTPTYLHKEQTIKCARAGKHIFCEKPIALNLKDADEMIKATKKTKVKFMVGMIIRFWPEYVKLKEIVDSGKYGKLTSIILTRLGASLGSARAWYGDVEKSGGILELHIHDVDYIYYLLGRPKSVYSCGVKDRSGKGYSHICTIYEYTDKVVFAEAGWDILSSFGFVHAFRATFEDGTTIEYNLKYQPMVIFRDTKEEVKMPEELARGGWYNEINYWVECLKRDIHPEIVTPEDVRNSLEVALKEFESADSNKKIVL